MLGHDRKVYGNCLKVRINMQQPKTPKTNQCDCQKKKKNKNKAQQKATNWMERVLNSNESLWKFEAECKFYKVQQLVSNWIGLFINQYVSEKIAIKVLLKEKEANMNALHQLFHCLMAEKLKDLIIISHGRSLKLVTIMISFSSLFFFKKNKKKGWRVTQSSYSRRPPPHQEMFDTRR